MNLIGSIDIDVPRDRVARAIRDPAMLRQMIPGCVGVSQISGTAYRARIARQVGPVALKLTVDLTVEPVEENRSYTLTARGRNMIAGSVEVRVAMALDAAARGTRLDHDATIRATGLADRLLRTNEGAFRSRTDGMFRRLKRLLETETARPT